AGHRITVVNAGSLPPLIYRCQTGGLEYVGGPDHEGSGMPLGVFADPTQFWPTTRAELLPGDCVMAFTDGVTEMRDSDGATFGMAGLFRAVRDKSGPGEPRVAPPQLGEHVVRAALKHAAGCGQADDMALMCFGRLQAKDEAPARHSEP